MTLPSIEPRFDEEIIIAKYMSKGDDDILEIKNERLIRVFMYMILVGSIFVLASFI